MLLGQIQTLVVRHSYSHAGVESWCESLAKIIASGSQPVHRFVEEFDEFVAKVLPSLKGKIVLAVPLYLMMDALLFNVASNLERVRRIAEDAMVESTGSGEFEPKKMHATLQAFDSRTQQLVERLVNSPELRAALLLFSKDGSMKLTQLSMLVQTCDYLVERYSIRAKNYTEARQAIIHLLEDIQEPSSKEVEACNKMVFSEQALVRLANLIRKGSISKQQYFSLFRLMEAHWCTNKKERKLFVGCSNNGQQSMAVLLEELVGRSHQEIVFSESHSQTAEYCFIDHYLVFRFLPIYHDFCKVFNQLKHEPTESQFYQTNRGKLPVLVDFIKGLSGSKFSNFLHGVCSVISKKRSQVEATELIKLLLLNRFLLNPQFKVTYDKMHFHPKEYLAVANCVKALFFPNKLQGNSPALQHSAAVHAAYLQMISNFDPSSELKRYLYLNDCVLHRDYQKLKEVVSQLRRALPSEHVPQMRSATHHVSFQQPSLSTVHKDREHADNPSSVKKILRDISDNSNTERFNGSSRTEQNSTEQEPMKVEELPQPFIDDAGIMEYLQALRLQQSQRHKNRQHYLQSLRRSKHQFSAEFDRTSQRLNQGISDISRSRLDYELYEQLNRE